jgi:hypothetical protein
MRLTLPGWLLAVLNSILGGGCNGCSHSDYNGFGNMILGSFHYLQTKQSNNNFEVLNSHSRLGSTCTKSIVRRWFAMQF